MEHGFGMFNLYLKNENLVWNLGCYKCESEKKCVQFVKRTHDQCGWKPVIKMYTWDIDDHFQRITCIIPIETSLIIKLRKRVDLPMDGKMTFS